MEGWIILYLLGGDPQGITVRRMATLWFFGDMAKEIRPFRLLNRRFDIHEKDKMNCTRENKVCETIVNYVYDNGFCENGKDLQRYQPSG